MRQSDPTRDLIIAASALGGLLAGANADRFIVGRHAWRRVGVQSWAAYSREADLSSTGAVFYPALAIGGAACSVLAAVRFRSKRRAPRRAALPLSLAALLTLGGLLVTTKAAPFMLSLRK